VAIVLAERIGRYDRAGGHTHPEHIPSLTAAMADKTSGPQAEILNGYRFPPRTVADIDGADGSVLLSLIADEPDRQAIVFDRRLRLLRDRVNTPQSNLRSSTSIPTTAG
jgi:hypothetical protein